MTLTWLQAVVMGIVQGLTEFLPISSSAHLRVIPAFLGWPDAGAAFTAVIQLGTVLAVLIYFRKELVAAIGAWARSLRDKKLRETPDARLGWAVFWGTVPVIVVALVFQHAIEQNLRDLRIIAFSMIFLGLLMWYADSIDRKKRKLESVKVKDGWVVGAWQCLALVPGMSRSGSTISGAFFRDFNRPAAARFSFLLSVPSVTGAGIYELIKARRDFEGSLMAPTIVATVLAFIVGYASIAFFIKYLQKHGIGPFVWYRLLIGFIILIAVQGGYLSPMAGVPDQVPSISGSTAP